MQIYSYTIPDIDSFYNSIPIYDNHNNVISVIRKNRHRFLTQILHLLLRDGMPYCYNVFSKENKPIYKLDCTFTGIGYTLENYKTRDKIPIVQNRVQLIEKVQSFVINGDVYQLEKDYTYSGTLKKNSNKIATVRNLDNTNINLTNRIRIEAINDELASLIAILYQTFIY